MACFPGGKIKFDKKMFGVFKLEQEMLHTFQIECISFAESSPVYDYLTLHIIYVRFFEMSQNRVFYRYPGQKYEVQSESSQTVCVVLFVFKEESQNFAH